MFTKKYSPSIKANNQLRDKVVAEINSFIYRLERGRYSSESDHEAILRIIEDLKADVEILSNTVGTGEENIGALADGILDLLKDLKKSSEQDTLHRIQEVADDFKKYVSEQIDNMSNKILSYQITQDDKLFWKEVTKADEFFFWNLCGYTAKNHKPFQEYLNRQNQFDLSTLTKDYEDDVDDDLLKELFSDL